MNGKIHYTGGDRVEWLGLDMILYLKLIEQVSVMVVGGVTVQNLVIGHVSWIPVSHPLHERAATVHGHDMRCLLTQQGGHGQEETHRGLTLKQ